MRAINWVRQNRVLSPNFGGMVGWLVIGTVGWFLGWRYSIAAVYVLSVLALAETRGAAWAAERKLMREQEREADG